MRQAHAASKSGKKEGKKNNQRENPRKRTKEKNDWFEPPTRITCSGTRNSEESLDERKNNCSQKIWAAHGLRQLKAVAPCTNVDCVHGQERKRNVISKWNTPTLVSKRPSRRCPFMRVAPETMTWLYHQLWKRGWRQLMTRGEEDLWGGVKVG